MENKKRGVATIPDKTRPDLNRVESSQSRVESSRVITPNNLKIIKILKKYLPEADDYKKKAFETWITKLELGHEISSKALNFMTNLIMEIETKKYLLQKLEDLGKEAPAESSSKPDTISSFDKIVQEWRQNEGK